MPSGGHGHGHAPIASSGDWRVEHSRKLNRPFYYNVRTKESRWSPPPGIPRAVINAANADAAASLHGTTAHQAAASAAVNATSAYVPHNPAPTDTSDGVAMDTGTDSAVLSEADKGNGGGRADDEVREGSTLPKVRLRF